MGFLDDIGLSKLKNGLAKTRTGLVEKVTRLINARTSLDDETLDQLEEILISSDVGAATSVSIIDSIRERVGRDGFTDTSELDALLKSEIGNQFT
ncbi:MAG: signal recognition particle receptor subunit alpha, partial [Bacteroidetes bacterium]|nr:signal recognition particle receptor subunit alpha [Bacteroidota bacterium]